MTDDRHVAPAGSPSGDGPADARFAFDPGWSVAADGTAQSGPGGGDGRIILPAFDGAPPQGLQPAFRMRLVVQSPAPSDAFHLTVVCRGTLVRELVAFAEAEYQVDLLLPAWSAAQYRLGVRADPIASAVPGGGPGAEAPPPATVSVLKVEMAWQAADDRGKEMVIEAGLAAARSLFGGLPPEDRRSAAVRLAGLIGEAIRSRAPFSVIRLGDGEGRLLAHPGVLTETEIEIETIWWQFGPGAVEQLKSRHGSRGVELGIATLQKLIRQAIRSADCVGLPRPDHFESVASKAADERRRLSNATAGYAGVLIAMAPHLHAFAPERLFDTYVFHEIHHGSLFAGFLSGLPYLGLVSHTDRSREIGAHFGIGRVEHFPVPGHHVRSPSAELHFPERYRAIAAGLRVPFTGAPFLVASGYLGKFYCDVIKARGGIAIDIGSVFDGWFGAGRADAIRNPSMRLTTGEAGPRG
jgi:hypothetical protein